jgi:hypothetical protein
LHVCLCLCYNVGLELQHPQFYIPGGRRVSTINEASQNSAIGKSFHVSFYCTISKQISC